MWWCCGKSTHNAPGCRFGQHATNEDKEENEEVKDPSEVLRTTRCMCCKELGHTIDQCPKDPNFKTKSNQDNEDKRVMRIFLDKRGIADTAVQTTHLLKKCFLVQNKDLKQSQLINSSFKRGAMQFEDFNYAMFNPYILINEGTEEVKKPKNKQMQQKDLNHPLINQYKFEQILEPYKAQPGGGESSELE